MNSYKRALAISKAVHKNQVDLSGKPYILHPLFVANHVKGKKAKIVALLHDVLEDSNLPLSYLEQYFSQDICLAVDLLTRKKQDYSSYIEQIKLCRLAREVKIADLKHNMMITRLNRLTELDFKRLKKYHAAYKVLTNEQ